MMGREAGAGEEEAMPLNGGVEEGGAASFIETSNWTVAIVFSVWAHLYATRYSLHSPKGPL